MNASLLFSLAAASFWFGAVAVAQTIPSGYVIPDLTLSPDHRYGVMVPKTEDEDHIPNPKNTLVEAKTGRVMAKIIGDSFGWDQLNSNEVLPSRWSTDSSLLLWTVSGKWCPDVLVLIKLENGSVKWQLDLLKTGQQAALVRTKKAEPVKFAAAKKENEGNGSAYPEGFTVDVHVVGQDPKSVKLPLKVLVNLTSNPKEIPDMTTLVSQLEGIVDEKGKFATTKFRFITSAELDRSEAEADKE